MTYMTSDIAIAAFLMTKGVKLKSASREKNGKFKIVFDDPNNECDALSVEYINSDFSRFDACIKNLKSIIFKNNWYINRYLRIYR